MPQEENKNKKVKSKFEKAMQDTQNAIAAAQTAVNKYPTLSSAMNMAIGGSASVSFDFIFQLLEMMGVTKEDIIDMVAGIFADDNGNSTLLDAIETGIKSVLWSNLKTLYTCSVNPFLSDVLMYHYEGFDSLPEGSDISLNGDGITISMGNVDMYKMLDRNPHDEMGSKYFFDIKDESLNDWKSCDFDLFLWYVKHKSLPVYPESTHLMWDNRVHDFDGYLKVLDDDKDNEGNSVFKKWRDSRGIDETAATNFSDYFHKKYDNDKKVPYSKDIEIVVDDLDDDQDAENPADISNVIRAYGDTKFRKYQYFYCEYRERGTLAEGRDVLKVWLNPERYYRKRHIKAIVPVFNAIFTLNSIDIDKKEYDSMSYKDEATVYIVKDGNTYTAENTNSPYIKALLSGDTITGTTKSEIKNSIKQYKNRAEGLSSITIDDKTYLRYNKAEKTELEEAGILDREGNSINTFYKLNFVGMTKSETKTIKFNKTVFEFNYDYIYGIKLFNVRTLLSNIANGLLYNVFDDISSIRYSFEESLIEGRIGSIVEGVLAEEDIVDSEDCFYKFDNDKYDKLLAEYLKKRKDGELNIVSGETSEAITNLLNSIDEVTPEGKREVVTNVINGIIDAIPAESDTYDIVAGGSASFHSNFLSNLIKEIITQLLKTLLTPKVLILYAMNIAMMGNPFEEDEDGYINTSKHSLGFDAFEANINNIIIANARVIKNMLLRYFISLLSKYYMSLMTAYTAILQLESLAYYEQAIRQALSCIQTSGLFGVGSTSGNARHIIDNVNYAEIITDAIDNTPDVVEDKTETKGC